LDKTKDTLYLREKLLFEKFFKFFDPDQA